MNSKIKIGISYTDFRFEEYIKYLNSSDHDIDIIVLNYEKNNWQDLDSCDGLVLSGGKDINPAIYGKENEISKCGTILPDRDSFELKLIDLAFNKVLPIFGICRGHQLVNVSNMFGGTLFTDIASIHNMNTINHSNNLPEGEKHEITVFKGTLLESILGTNKISVNSFHHQAVEKVGKGLQISSVAPDGIIESLEWENPEDKPFLLLVQWHPERLLGEDSSKLLINYFYNKIKSGKR